MSKIASVPMRGGAPSPGPPDTARRAVPAGSDPLWRRVAADLRSRLARGEFADAFPGEHTIATAYGVSRFTVREALRDLRGEGLVTAARGRPSRVRAPNLIEQSTGALYSLFTSVRDAGLAQHSIVRTLDVRTDPAAAAELGLDDETEFVYLERLRLAGEEPLAIDCARIPVAVGRGLLHADFAHTSLYEELRRTCSVVVTSGRERVRAAVPDEATRSALGIGPGIATLTIARTGYAAADPVEFRETQLRGDLFALTNHYPEHDAGE